MNDLVRVLARLEKAEALLRESQVGTHYLHPSWFDRRDAFLTPPRLPLACEVGIGDSYGDAK